MHEKAADAQLASEADNAAVNAPNAEPQVGGKSGRRRRGGRVGALSDTPRPLPPPVPLSASRVASCPSAALYVVAVECLCDDVRISVQVPEGGLLSSPSTLALIMLQ